jgi:hypothetical protein
VLGPIVSSSLDTCRLLTSPTHSRDSLTSFEASVCLSILSDSFIPEVVMNMASN